MSCYDGKPEKMDFDEWIDETRQFYQTLVRLSCDRCRELEARGTEVPVWAQKWWRKHKENDAARLDAEESARKDLEVRKTAISKLTKEEREELGV